MTTEITVGTGNNAKVQQIRGALSPLDIIVMGVENTDLLPTVPENGQTTLENARNKALAFACSLGRTVLSMDNALYLDGLDDDSQPGLNVRRIPGSTIRPNDQELLEYYTQVVNNLGGKTDGHWEFGVCVANSGGVLGETTIVSDRVFTSKASGVVIPGYPLDSLQIDPSSGKYISEMSPKEHAEFWQMDIGKKLCNFIISLGLDR